MAYPYKADKNAFFVAKTAVAGTDCDPLNGIDIGAANATHGEFVCVVPCTMREASFICSLEAVVGTTTAPYIILKKYTTPAAGGTATTIGTITVPSGTAIGKTIYKEDLNVDFAVGDVVEIQHVIGTGGSVAGQGHVTWSCDPDPETAANNSDMSESST